MWCTEQAFFPVRQQKPPVTHGLHRRGLKRLGIGYAQQNAGQMTGKHGLAGAGRIDFLDRAPFVSVNKGFLMTQQWCTNYLMG